jgi:hypothetical protein
MLSQAICAYKLYGLIRTIGVRFNPVLMAETLKCPHCGHAMPALWQSLYRLDRGSTPRQGITHYPREEDPTGQRLLFDYMACFNDECRQVIVRIQRIMITKDVPDLEVPEESWFAIPRKPAPRPIDPLVPDDLKQRYAKAALILGDAPEMSGVLSRRILIDLLRKYANRDEYKLDDQINKFIDDPAYPSSLKDNLHHLREIGNFGAHTKENKSTGDVVEIGVEEATWTLDVIDGLFDYFIVGPEKNRLRREAWDKKRGPQNPPAKKKP